MYWINKTLPKSQISKIICLSQVWNTVAKRDSVSPCSICQTLRAMYRWAHTHTLGFHVLCGHSVDIMIFYTVQTAYSIPYPGNGKLPAFLQLFKNIFQKASFRMILFSSWGPKISQQNHKFLVLLSLWRHFVPTLGNTWDTHTHAHKHWFNNPFHKTVL